MSLRSGDLDSVGELYTEDDFRQLVVTVETTPAFLGGLDQLEDHGDRRLVLSATVDRRRHRAHSQLDPRQIPALASRPLDAGRQSARIEDRLSAARWEDAMRPPWPHAHTTRRRSVFASCNTRCSRRLRATRSTSRPRSSHAARLEQALSPAQDLFRPVPDGGGRAAPRETAPEDRALPADRAQLDGGDRI